MIETKQRSSGMYYFVVKAKNGHIMATSENFNSEAGRDNAIASLKRIVQGIIFADLKN